MKDAPNILVMVESSRESGRKLISGIADYARHFGPWRFHWEPQGLKGLTGAMGELRFDGVLARNVADLSAYADEGIPTVAFTYGMNDIANSVTVDTDDAGIAKMVATHFLQRGFKNFAYCGQEGALWAARRGRHFEEVLAVAGFEVVQLVAPSSLAGARATRADLETTARWLRSLPTPVLLMAANDDLAQSLVQLCLDCGLRVPDDCALIGVDNDPVICGLCNPPLSSVSVNQYKAGYRAAEILAGMIRGETPERWTVTAEVVELVERQSSDIIAVEDKAVAKALRFIRSNADRPLSVDEVAKSSGVHRRSLERRFREHLSLTVQQYCRETRAEHVAKVLTGSSLSLEEIAWQCAFPQASHLTRFFSTVRGETPSAYRKRCTNA
ncbi:substrate-binding domain-containing protein [Luteolibacter algae]|uniref:Substrate-binding domain-containing protein n=1 Tax=Luteolibacter algae TaxID=454151 RepID=A0ABW5D9X6_9BACT